MQKTEALMSKYREYVCERKAINDELLKNMEQLIPNSEKLVGGLLKQVDHKFNFAPVAIAWSESDQQFLQAYMAKPCETKFEESPYGPFFENLMAEIEENYRDRIVCDH